jgi:hypothetical protein
MARTRTSSFCEVARSETYAKLEAAALKAIAAL